MPIEPPQEELPGYETTKDWASDLQSPELAPYWLSAIIESAEDAIVSKTLEGRITSWNKGAERLFGYTAEEIVGESVTLLIPEDHLGEEPTILARLRAGERIEHYETVRMRKDGTLIDISLTVSPIRNADGIIIGASKIARDITDRKRDEEALRRSEGQLSDFFENAVVGLHLVGPDGTILRANRAELEMLGYAPEEYIGHHIAEFYVDSQVISDILKRLQVGEVLSEYEARLRCKDGSIKHVLIDSSVMWENGVFVHTRCFMRDISERKRAEEELSESRRQLETVFNNATVSLFIVDERQHCTYMNPAAEKLTGFTLAEVQGQPLHNFVHHVYPDGKPYPLEECPIDRALPQNNHEQGEEVFVHKDGSFYPVAFTASPIREKGVPVGTIVEVRDTTQEKRALAERERLLELEQEAREETETINQLGQVLSGELDLHKLVQAVTDAATELTGARYGSFFYNVLNEEGASYMLYTLSGVPREAFEHFPMPRATDLFGPTFRGEGVMRINDVKQDPRYGKNSPYYGMPEGHLPVTSYLAVSVMARSGEVLGGLFFAHPEAGVFTERHERMVTGLAAQAAIAMDNARLFQTAQRAAAENERLYREAQEASRLKDEFLATISHELRTPLTAILGWSHMLRTGQFQGDSALKALETIERNARAQGQLIDDLLDVSRIITGKLRIDLRPVDPNSFIEAAIEAVMPAAEAKGVRIQKIMDTGVVSVAGDPVRLQQVVWNLLSNAIKFTPRDGRVQIRLERVNSHVEIAVIDTGAGIAPEFLPHVFDRFRQADQRTTRQHGGMGLGLAIARHLVEMHGGTIKAESPGRGEGATFTVLLPVSPVYQADAESARVHPAARDPLSFYECPDRLDGLRILVVDDEPDARELLKVGLAQCGAEVTAVSSAAEALEAIALAPPDLLISDIGMPEVDGYELIRKVRGLAHDEGGKVPAIALTAYARTEDRLQALRAGYQMHVPKPVELTELVTVAASLIQRAG